MDRALGGDFREPGPLFVVEIACDEDFSSDVVKEAVGVVVAMFAVVGMDLVVGVLRRHCVQGPSFALAVEGEGDTGACAQCSQEELIRGRSGVGSVDVERFVGMPNVASVPKLDGGA